MPQALPIRVLIAGQDNAFRTALCQLVENSSRIQVIGRADSAREAVDLALTHHPDLVLMDMTIGGTNGLAATRALKGQQPTVPVILLSILHEQEYLGVARHSGVDRCLNKEDIGQKLLPVIDSLMALGHHHS